MQNNNSYKLSRLIYLLVLVFIATHMETKAASLEGYGAAFLRAPLGTRAFAMGGAQSVSPDYAIAWWNPAALSLMKSKSIALGGGVKSLGRTEAYLTFDMPLPPRMGIGGAILYRGISTLDNLYDAQEYKIDDATYRTISGKFGLSYQILKKLSAGLSLSFIYQKLPTDYSGKSIIYSKVASFSGIDIAVRYVINKKLTQAIFIKNLLSQQTWNINRAQNSSDFNTTVVDTFPLITVLAQEYKGSMAKRPFIWDIDLSGYFVNSKFKKLGHSHVVIDNGFEWQAWKIFYIRAGIGDFEINTEMFRNSRNYWSTFSLAATGGFMVDLSTILKGKDLKFNCGLANDKVGAGVEFQADVSFNF